VALNEAKNTGLSIDFTRFNCFCSCQGVYVHVAASDSPDLCTWLLGYSNIVRMKFACNIYPGRFIQK